MLIELTNIIEDSSCVFTAFVGIDQSSNTGRIRHYQYYTNINCQLTENSESGVMLIAAVR
jgi:hypothetical protein